VFAFTLIHTWLWAWLCIGSTQTSHEPQESCYSSFSHGCQDQRSRGKERPPKEHPPPTFGPISCIGSKLNERPHRSELRVEFEKHILKRYAYLRYETSCYASSKVTTSSIHINKRSYKCGSHHELNYAHGAVQSVVYRHGLDFEAAGRCMRALYICCTIFASRDVMTWRSSVGGSTQKSAHPPLLQTCKILAHVRFLWDYGIAVKWLQHIANPLIALVYTAKPWQLAAILCLFPVLQTGS